MRGTADRPGRPHQRRDGPKRGRLLGALIVLLCSVFSASDAEEFGVEEAFARPADVPAVVAAEVLRSADGEALPKCLADAGKTARAALEATAVDLWAGRRPRC